MIFHENVVFSEDIKNPEKVKNKLNNKSGLKNYYVVAFREEFEKPEIYGTLQFKQKNLSSEKLEVVGVFEGEDEAYEFIRKLTEIAVNAGTFPDFRQAFAGYVEVSE